MKADFLPIRILAPALLPVSVTEVKKHLVIDHSDDDAYLGGLIDAAVSHLDGWSGKLGRCMIAQTWRFTWSRWAAQAQIIPFPDVSDIVITYRDDNDTGQVLSDTNYRFAAVTRGTRIEWTDTFLSPSLFNRSDAVVVDVDCGYGPAASDVPPALRTAIMMLVADWYERREVTSADGHIELPYRVKSLIKPFRRNTV